MRYIFFTKMVREQSIPELIQTLRHIGADGADMAVRDGYPVNPANARKALPAAVRELGEAGLVVPMVTAPTGLVDPRKPEAEELFAACHDAGVDHIKLGYWVYGGGDYWKQFDEARRAMDGFEKLATRFGVKACLHTHSGPYLTVNAAALMSLVRGHNPAHVGAYLDPGHLAINGEPFEMAFAMAAEYLSLVAIKDSLWVKEGDKPRRDEWLPLGQGFVDWHELMRVLIARRYDGPLSFHSEYETLPTDALIEQTRKDIAFLRRVEAEVRKA